MRCVDIYTKQIINLNSREHVLPNFLGGRIQINNLIDKQTNDIFGSGIDAELDKATAAIRNLIDARSAREPNRPAPMLRNVVGADGSKYHIEAGGQVILIPKLRIEQGEGCLTVKGSVSEQGQLRQGLRKFVQTKGLNLDDVIEQCWKIARTTLRSPPPMNFPLRLWDMSPYRAIAKIACNWLASHDRCLFMRAEFDPIREFVLNCPTQPSPPPVQAIDLDLRKGGIGPVDHFVSVEVLADGRVRGVVVLFGTLAFVIRLAEVFKLIQPFRHSYRIDQITHHDRRDHVTDLALNIESFEIAAARSFEQFADLVKIQQERLLPTLLEVQRRHWIGRIIKPYWDKFLANMGDEQEPSDKAKLEFSREVAQAFADQMRPNFEAAADRRHQQQNIAEDRDS